MPGALLDVRDRLDASLIAVSDLSFFLSLFFSPFPFTFSSYSPVSRTHQMFAPHAPSARSTAAARFRRRRRAV